MIKAKDMEPQGSTIPELKAQLRGKKPAAESKEESKEEKSGTDEKDVLIAKIKENGYEVPSNLMSDLLRVSKRIDTEMEGLVRSIESIGEVAKGKTIPELKDQLRGGKSQGIKPSTIARVEKSKNAAE